MISVMVGLKHFASPRRLTSQSASMGRQPSRRIREQGTLYKTTKPSVDHQVMRSILFEPTLRRYKNSSESLMKNIDTKYVVIANVISWNQLVSVKSKRTPIALPYPQEIRREVGEAHIPSMFTKSIFCLHLRNCGRAGAK